MKRRKRMHELDGAAKCCLRIKARKNNFRAGFAPPAISGVHRENESITLLTLERESMALGKQFSA
jgi:hypothetical protein